MYVFLLTRLSPRLAQLAIAAWYALLLLLTLAAAVDFPAAEFRYGAI